MHRCFPLLSYVQSLPGPYESETFIPSVIPFRVLNRCTTGPQSTWGVGRWRVGGIAGRLEIPLFQVVVQVSPSHTLDVPGAATEAQWKMWWSGQSLCVGKGLLCKWSHEILRDMWSVGELFHNLGSKGHLAPWHDLEGILMIHIPCIPDPSVLLWYAGANLLVFSFYSDIT